MMIERDLQAASDLFDKIKYAQSSITIAKADAVSLRVHYKTEPFKHEEDGKLYQHISAAGALGIDAEEMRVLVCDAIVKHLESKIAEYRAQLGKMGVKLDEPPKLEPEKKGKQKKLAAPKKPLQLEAPKAPGLRAVQQT